MITRFKRFLPRVLPESIALRLREAASAVRIVCGFVDDCRRYLRRASLSDRARSKAHLSALIMMDCHRIEKGLALRNPRVYFGKAVVSRLLDNLKVLQERYGLDVLGKAALDALCEYDTYVRQQGEPDDSLLDCLAALRQRLPADLPEHKLGGIKTVTRESLQRAAMCDISAFFDSRHSIRTFSPEPVDLALITQAVSLARRTPSVCNRQTCRVHVVHNKEDLVRVLELQNGNRGFRAEVDKLLLITSEMTSFLGPAERNQCWIECGMFGMSLVYALHSLGLATCCLNWCVTSTTDRAMKELIDMGDSEVIGMAIAVGGMPEQFRVAKSLRKSVSEILHVVRTNPTGPKTD